MLGLPRAFVAFALCIPLAILLGVMLANPLDSSSMMFVGAAFLLLLTPFLLQCHHAVLVFSWNALVIVFFLPGQPFLWLLGAVVSLFFTLLTRTLNRTAVQFYLVPSVAVPLLFLALVIYVTAKLTGGVGARVFGSDVFGARKYFYLWGAVIGFFAFVSKAIPEEKVGLYAGLFFLSSCTAVFSNLAYTLGEPFYFLFLLFPAGFGAMQAQGEEHLGSFVRLAGLAPASLGIISFMLMRHGLRGFFELARPWRLVILVLTFSAGLFSGYRSQVVLIALICIVQFLAEGLFKTRYLFAVLLVGLMTSAVLFPVADRLPLSVQRCLTFLPLRLDPMAVMDARGSLEWRMEMWRLLMGDVPKYLWLGKGFAINPTELYLADESAKRGFISAQEPSIISGDYHNGPLTILIPFGIWGAIGFAAFAWASLRLLWRNYKFSPPSLINANRFLLTYFIARLVFFLIFFGAFHFDLPQFIGIVGMSIAINKGMRTAPAAIPVTAPAPVVLPVPRRRPRSLPVFEPVRSS